MKKAWLYAAAVALAAGIGALIQDWVRVRVLRPVLGGISRFSFALGVYWRTQDQELIWGAFVLVAVLLAAAAFSGLWTGRKRRGVTISDRNGRLDYWADQLRSVEEGTYYQWRFSQEIGRLIMQKLTLERGETQEDLEDQLGKGQLDLPDEIRRFLLGAYRKKLHQFYPGPGEKSSGEDLPEINPERLIDYLEQP